MRSLSSFVALGLGVLAVLCPVRRAFARAEIGQAAPALVVKELNGRTFNLADARGSVVVVNFWASWCPPCRKEMPALNQVYRRYHGRGLKMIALSVDHAGRLWAVKKAMKAFKYPAAMLADAQANGFGEPSELPVTYVVGTHGIVRAKLSPGSTSLTVKKIARVILPLLPHKSAPRSSAAGHDTQR